MLLHSIYIKCTTLAVHVLFCMINSTWGRAEEIVRWKTETASYNITESLKAICSDCPTGTAPAATHEEGIHRM